MTANRTITELYQALRPLLLRDVAIAASGSRASSGGMTAHALNSNWHTGQLAETQAPWAATKNEWATALATHAALPDVHHAAVTAGTMIGLSGQQVSVANGSAQYQVPVTGANPFAPSWTTLASFAGAGMAFSGGQFAVGVANTGATGLSVEADAVRLTTSSNPGAAASVLASDGSGYLSLVRLTLSDRVRTTLIDTASGNLTVQPAADLMLAPGSNLVKLTTGKSFQSDGYASQATGMRISAAGEGDFRYLYVDEMHAKSFVADLEQALAGGQIISKSVAVLAVNFTLPAAGATGTLRVRDLPSAPNMAVFQSGDFVGLRQFSRSAGSLSIGWAWGTVTAYADQSDGTQTWTFTRHASTPGAASGTIAADALVLDYGTSGNGFYEVNAIDGAYGGNSPYAQIVSWSTHPATGATVRTRFGNLRGLFGVENEYGMYAGAGTATSDAYLRISNTEVGLYNLPLRMYTGGTERVHIAAHNDVWIGPSSADKRLSWDGSTLTVTGKINVVGGNAATIDNVTGAQNLVANASFETDSNADGLADEFSIYNNDGGSVPTTASRVAGEKSAWAQRISWTGTNASTKGVWFNSVTTKRANIDYVLSFWARTSTAVNLAFYENAPASTQTQLVWQQANTTWQFYAVRLRWSSTPAASFYLSIANGTAIANGWIEFDNVQVVENTDIVPWALAPTDKADTSLGNSVISTLINGANIRVGSGTKDSTLNGWNIDSTEIVGQASGVDQVVLDTSGQIVAGAGRVLIAADGLKILADATASNALSQYRFRNSGNTANVGGMGAWVGETNWQSNNATTGQRVHVASIGQSSQDSGLTLYAEAVSGRKAISALQAYVVGGPLASVEVTSTSSASAIAVIADSFSVSGVVGTDWTEMTPNNNWANYGSPNATLGYKTFGSFVSIKGVVRAGATIAANTAISNTQLPAAARPTAGRSFACMGSIGGAKAVVRVLVDPSGYIRPQDGFGNTDWLSVEFTYFTGG